VDTIKIDPKNIGNVPKSKFSERNDWEVRIGWLKITRFINRQCISLGITINWNYKCSVEFSFFLWNFDIEFDRKKPKRYNHSEEVLV
jgi:hypothetical protein